MHSFFIGRGLTYRLNQKCRGLLLVMLVLGAQLVYGQAEVYNFTPADSQYVMELARGKNEVTITITFNDSVVFDYVSIERRASFTPEFSQCSYISYDDVKKKGRHIVKKDSYPYPASSDVEYRIKWTSADGAMRTYPSLTLPAIK